MYYVIVSPDYKQAVGRIHLDKYTCRDILTPLRYDYFGRLNSWKLSLLTFDDKSKAENYKDKYYPDFLIKKYNACTNEILI